MGDVVIVLWVAALVMGIVGAAFGSRHAVTAALEIADELGISKGLIGVTLVAIGTDLPEIANSISASVSGHGDVNVGDSTGSALTQVTLIVAVLLAASPKMLDVSDRDGRRLVAPAGVMTVAATLVIALLISDGQLSRADGLLLVALWAASLLALRRLHPSATDDRVERSAAPGRSLLRMLVALAVVAGSATLVVQAFVELSEAVGVPELIASTVVLALGTSFPELVVDWTAIRRGAAALAVGDLFGSSLVDASLSIGIGPVFRSTAVSSEAVTSVLIVAAGVAAATIAWLALPRLRAVRAGTFAGVYGVAMLAIVLWAS